MQALRIVLVLISVGCILGPIGAMAVQYRSNLSQMVLTPQLQQLTHFGNNNNSNNNNGNNGNNNTPNNNGNNNSNNPGNNNNNPNNDSNNNNNDNNNESTGSNSGNVNNLNPLMNNSTYTFGGLGQFDINLANNDSQSSNEISTNIYCMVFQSGNNIQLSLDLTPTNVPNSLEPVFTSNNDYIFNFVGTTSDNSSGTQITANSQGSLNSGSTFNLNLNGAIDQNQDTLTFTITSGSNAQANITTPQAIGLQPNSGSDNYNSNNNNNDNNGNNSNNNNNPQGVNPLYTGGTINTSKKTITLTFSLTNALSQSTTINSMTGTLELTADQTQLGTVNSSSPTTISSGQTVTVTVSGTLTQEGLNELNNNYSHANSVNVTIVNAQMTEDGVTNQGAQSQNIGNIAISW